MAQSYMRYCTALSDLQQGAKRIYLGKFYESKAGEIYSFVSFIDCCPDGQVFVRNHSRGGLRELLTLKEWNSFIRVNPQKNKIRKNTKRN
jgi:hypothetical protein